MRTASDFVIFCTTQNRRVLSKGNIQTFSMPKIIRNNTLNMTDSARTTVLSLRQDHLKFTRFYRKCERTLLCHAKNNLFQSCVKNAKPF